MEKQDFRYICSCPTQVENTKEYGKTLSRAANRLGDYLSEYQHVFKNRTKKFFDKAQQYIQGTIVSQKRNLEQVCDTFQLNYFQIQHFFSDSNWSSRNLIDLVVKETSKVLPIRKLTGLIIDESGIVKQGDKSVGVGWQYCGNVGKLTNSQVAVLACLSNGDFASLVDARLYLPEDWTLDENRCEQADIPSSDRAFKTKIDIAWDMITHMDRLGISFDYVGADGFYGNDVDFASKIDSIGHIYMLDIHNDQSIYLDKPELLLPERKSDRGPSPKLLKATTDSITGKKYFDNLDPEQWQKIKVRKTAKGNLKALYHFQEVWVWNKKLNLIERRMLVIRKIKTKKGQDVKYSFTNADLVQYTPQALAYMQAQRFFIEHCIKESKQVLGLSEYQTRKWNALNHQVAINILVMCFMLKEKLLCFNKLPLLSARDIREWLSFCFMIELTEE